MNYTSTFKKYGQKAMRLGGYASALTATTLNNLYAGIDEIVKGLLSAPKSVEHGSEISGTRKVFTDSSGVDPTRSIVPFAYADSVYDAATADRVTGEHNVHFGVLPDGRTTFAFDGHRYVMNANPDSAQKDSALAYNFVRFGIFPDSVAAIPADGPGGDVDTTSTDSTLEAAVLGKPLPGDTIKTSTINFDFADTNTYKDGDAVSHYVRLFSQGQTPDYDTIMSASNGQLTLNRALPNGPYGWTVKTVKTDSNGPDSVSARVASFYINRAAKPDAPKSEKFHLYQSRPNPMDDAAAIVFDLATPSNVDIDIYNVLGQKVRDLFKGFVPSGQHTVTFDGRNNEHQSIANGVYLYRVETDHGVKTKKMTRIRTGSRHK